MAQRYTTRSLKTTFTFYFFPDRDLFDLDSRIMCVEADVSVPEPRRQSDRILQVMYKHLTDRLYRQYNYRQVSQQTPANR